MELLMWLTVFALSITALKAQSTTVATSQSQDVNSCPAGQGACVFQDDNVAVFPAKGGSTGEKLYLGGIFPVHERGSEAFSCGWINEDSFQEMMAFYWAVNRSNRLPGVSKGSVIFDSCGANYLATQAIFGIEKCRSKPRRVDGLSPASVASGNASQSTGVDRRSIAGYINAVNSRNGQLEDEASQIMVGLGKPVINTGTYTAKFSSKKPGARYNFVTPSVKQQMEATVDVLIGSVTSEEIFVMVVYSNDAFSMDAFNEFKMAAPARNICTIYEKKLEHPIQKKQLEEAAQEVLANKHGRFVLSLLSENNFRLLYRRIYDRTDNIFNLSFVFPPFAEGAGNVLLESNRVALGAVQVRHDRGVPHFEDFRNFYRTVEPEKFPTVPLVAEFWQQRFRCNLIGYSGNKGFRYRDFCNNTKLTLSNDDVTSKVAYIITAVDVLLLNIEKVRSEVCPGCGLPQKRFSEVIPDTILEGKRLFKKDTGGPASWQFKVHNLRRIKDVQRYVQVGNIRSGQQENKQFDIKAYKRMIENGKVNLEEIQPESHCPPRECQGCKDPPPPVTTLPPPNTTQSDVMERLLAADGRLVTHRVSHNASITGSFFRQRRQESEYTTRLYASNYRSVWSIALAALAGLGIVAVILLEISLIYLILTYKFEEPDGKRRSHLNFRALWLGQLLLFGIFLSYLTLFAYLPVPTKATCGITRFGIGISYAIIFSCLLVKLMIILHSRTAVPGEVNPSFQQSIWYMVSLFLIAFCVQLIIDVHWLIQIPPEAVLVRDNSGELAWICNHYTWSLQHGFWDMSTFVRTEFENHLLSLLYIMFLILVTFFLSLKAFDIVANMRESRFIALATGITILIFIAWAMIGGFLRDHGKAHEIGDGCIGFGLFFTSTVILFALFMSKVRQLNAIGMEGVFLEDDKDTNYASSIYSPTTHRSFSGYADGSVIGMHTMDRSVHMMGESSGINPDDSRPIINVDTSFMSNDPPFYSNPHALYLKHPRSSGPSLYSVRSTPNLYDPSEVYSNRGTTLPRNLTGRSYLNETYSGSEYPSLYRPKSEVLLYKPRSEIGSL